MHTLDERIRDEYKDLQTQNLKIGREKCEAVRGVRVIYTHIIIFNHLYVDR